MFKVTKCKDKAVYSAKPLKTLKLDLEKISKSFETLEKTPILLLVKIDGHEIIVHRHGELMFKDCTNINKITQISEKIYSIGTPKP
ncbi:hypothetical protein D6777_03740 [Candidatus Woesearchaeota archaeon]|nr:MAG: hypothetical protein D6777_03740 [Candidatus Woesearchaeota archaeon]